MESKQENPKAGLVSDRSLAFLEIVSVMTSCLIAEWVVFSIGRGSAWALVVPVAFAFVFMFASHRLRGESFRDIGLRFDNFMAAVRILALPMLAATVLLGIIGLIAGSLNFRRWSGGQSIFGLPALGILWGLMQQYALQGFINRRAQIVWGRGLWSVLFVAAMFAVLHFPNPLLTIITFAGGVLWAAVYQRVPNIFALALSHSLMTWVLICTAPEASLSNLRVGFKYFG